MREKIVIEVDIDTSSEDLRTKWMALTGDTRPEIFAQAMDPQSPAFDQVWRLMMDERLERVMGMSQVEGVNPAAVQVFLEATDELLRIRYELLAREQARSLAAEQAEYQEQAGQSAQTGQPAQPAQPAQAPVELDERDVAVGTAAAEASERGFKGTALATQYAGGEVKLVTQLTAVSPGAALSVGMDPDRAAAVGSTIGGTKRVERVYETLLELLSQRATTNLAAAGIAVGGTGRVARGEIPRQHLVNAALVLALRAGGTTGVELSPEGELLVELLGGTSGDLARSASLDAGLAEMMSRMEGMEKLMRNTHARSIEARNEAQVATMVASFGIAERLRVVRLPLSGPDVVASVDVTAPAAVGLLDQMREQVEGYARKRRDDDGRMVTASQFRARREQEEAQVLQDEMAPEESPGG